MSKPDEYRRVGMKEIAAIADDLIKHHPEEVPEVTPKMREDACFRLKYQNRRPDYLDAFWNVVNWDYVAERFAEAHG